MDDHEPMTVGACKEVHKQSLERFSQIQTSLAEMNARLYKDNGTLSIQTRLDRQQRAISIIAWVGSIILASVLVEVVAFGVTAVKYLIRILPQ